MLSSGSLISLRHKTGISGNAVPLGDSYTKPQAASWSTVVSERQFEITKFKWIHCIIPRQVIPTVNYTPLSPYFSHRNLLRPCLLGQGNLHSYLSMPPCHKSSSKYLFRDRAIWEKGPSFCCNVLAEKKFTASPSFFPNIVLLFNTRCRETINQKHSSAKHGLLPRPGLMSLLQFVSLYQPSSFQGLPPKAVFGGTDSKITMISAA